MMGHSVCGAGVATLLAFSDVPVKGTCLKKIFTTTCTVSGAQCGLEFGLHCSLSYYFVFDLLCGFDSSQSFRLR